MQKGVNMKGKLYGVGVGPGDPELLTLKAVRKIEECQVIAVPGEEKEKSVAYRIVKQILPEIDDKEILAIPMPMTKDLDKLEESHQKGADILVGKLEEGKQIAFLTLGDPTIYSTYIYLHKKILHMGYACEIINGIPSFCAVSAKLNMGLVEKSQPLHIVPASYQIGDALHLEGTKVLMKAGKKLPLVKEELKRNEMEAVMIENCGMENEQIYRTVDEIPEEAGYYSLIIIKEK
jgi:precorrin-2/cobalt-factor-2 C20-methyltransferase